MHETLAAADRLAEEGYAAEVIDIATLNHMTSRRYRLGGAPGRCSRRFRSARTAGFASEIAAAVAEHGMLSMMAGAARHWIRPGCAARPARKNTTFRASSASSPPRSGDRVLVTTRRARWSLRAAQQETHAEMKISSLPDLGEACGSRDRPVARQVGTGQTDHRWSRSRPRKHRSISPRRTTARSSACTGIRRHRALGAPLVAFEGEGSDAGAGTVVGPGAGRTERVREAPLGAAHADPRQPGSRHSCCPRARSQIERRLRWSRRRSRRYDHSRRRAARRAHPFRRRTDRLLRGVQPRDGSNMMLAKRRRSRIRALMDDADIAGVQHESQGAPGPAIVAHARTALLNAWYEQYSASPCGGEEDRSRGRRRRRRWPASSRAPRRRQTAQRGRQSFLDGLIRDPRRAKCLQKSFADTDHAARKRYDWGRYAVTRGRAADRGPSGSGGPAYANQVVGPMVRRVHKVLPLSLTFDHRAVRRRGGRLPAA